MTERKKIKLIWILIDRFNGMSIRIGVFYAKRLGNRVPCRFIFIFFVLPFINFIYFIFALCPIE